MVTYEVLKKSQKSRPRHWIPWVCLLALLVSGLIGAYFMLLVFSENDFSQMLIAMLPAVEITFLQVTLNIHQAMVFLILPAANLLILIFPMVISMKLCKYRGAYWWYGFLLVLAYILVPLGTLFYQLLIFVPALNQLAVNNFPIVLDILSYFLFYGNFVWPFMLALFMLFGLFYNLNYPAKYERIYELRKKRLKSLHLYEERSRYRRRFYYDYMMGNWDSMMLDFFAVYLDPETREPMPEDAFEFLCAYSEKCDGKANRAVFNELASQGRYKECRAYFAKAKAKGDSIDHGAKIVLPHYVPEKPKKPAPKPKPPRLDPPLDPKIVRRQPDARVRTWAPEDIA